jgi:hypothetical protein
MPSGDSTWKVGTWSAHNAASEIVLLELKPPMTTIASSGSRSSSVTASCRSCVALQIVSKVRKSASLAAAPRAVAIDCPTASAIANDSLASIVVWFATPTRCRCFDGWKPGDAACPSFVIRIPASSRPSMKSHTTRASCMSRTIR